VYRSPKLSSHPCESNTKPRIPMHGHTRPLPLLRYQRFPLTSMNDAVTVSTPGANLRNLAAGAIATSEPSAESSSCHTASMSGHASTCEGGG
jgi:hypothetical protein